MTEQDRVKALIAAQLLLDNGLDKAAEQQLLKAGISAVIRNGKIIDESDTTETTLASFITANKAMLELKDDVRKLSRTDHAVLITGETGTGKEILAKALHGKRQGKIITCNAAGLPENLVESLLFGHIRGAFTGAISDKIGYMTAAKNGTFFLDEIGELPLPAQAKLLRAIQQKVIQRVGDAADTEINCRFVFATNKNLCKMCESGMFRPDLYARIATFELATLPLRSREEDVKLILESMEGGKKFCEAYYSINAPNANNPMDLSFNVRSLEQYVARYNVLGKLP